MTSEQLPPVIALIGPTAVGKTALSLVLAEALNGEIVSADSRLFYRGMDIGTAKPTVEERMRVPHHLIDVADPDVSWSLARFCKAAFEAITQIHKRGRLPLIVGGTGQYITALLEGWDPPSQPADDQVRLELQAFADEQGIQALHQRLAQVDPEMAKCIDARNVRRVIRALEIFESTGKLPSTLRRKQPPPFRILRIGLTLPRGELYARIDVRIDRMLKDGLVEEVQDLLEQGVPPDVPAMSAIGYRQIVEYLQGEITLEEAVQLIRRASRVFVRRQSNWFKADDPQIHWFESRPDVESAILDFVRRWLEQDATNK